MRAETADYLAKARQCLEDARKIASLPLPHIAAREAYLAGFHAAEAYIFERTGKTAKTHRGVRSEFGRLGRDNPGIDPDFLAFLVETYEFKSIADYATGDAARAISGDDAAAAIDTAARFVECIAGLARVNRNAGDFRQPSIARRRIFVFSS